MDGRSLPDAGTVVHLVELSEEDVGERMQAAPTVHQSAMRMLAATLARGSNVLKSPMEAHSTPEWKNQLVV